jgi:antibiotic biosynthesis monooxygenase (ABM) superfamily enzyme
MTFLEKIRLTVFWKRFLIITVVFFIILVIISVLINSYAAILNFDMDQIMIDNFSDGKWLKFLIIKAIISVFYGLWVTNKNLKIETY